MKRIFPLAILLNLLSACTQSRYQFSDLYAYNHASPAMPDYSYQGTAETKVRVGDRDYIESVFLEVFGGATIVSGTTTVSAMLQERIHGYTSYFGSPCDPGYVDTQWIQGKSYQAGELIRFAYPGTKEVLYVATVAHTSSNTATGAGYCASLNAYFCKRANFRNDIGNWTLATTEGCLNRIESQVPMISGPTPAREALRVELCEQLTGSETTLAEAVTRATGTLSSAPGAADVQSVWELFHLGETVPDAVAQKLSALLVSTATVLQSESPSPSASDVARDQWRFLFLTVCRSPSWTIL